jgi:hypothetical protein
VPGSLEFETGLPYTTGKGVVLSPEDKALRRRSFPGIPGELFVAPSSFGGITLSFMEEFPESCAYTLLKGLSFLLYHG